MDPTSHLYIFYLLPSRILGIPGKPKDETKVRGSGTSNPNLCPTSIRSCKSCSRFLTMLNPGKRPARERGGREKTKTKTKMQE